jgi:diguanylate cyclase (GGDEF)-like protein/PAS domain S-box-containing protein
MRSRLRNRLAIVAACAGLAAALAGTGALSRVDLLIFDLVQATHRRPPPDDIVIIGIDEKSLDELGHWPWSRRHHGELTRSLTNAGARMILFDLLLPTLRPGDPDGDAEFAGAVSANGRVVLPVAFEALYPGGQPIEVLPFAALATNAAALGHADVEVDPDGRVRSVFLHAGLGAPVWPALALAAVAVADDTRAARSPSTPARGTPLNPFLWVRSDPILVPLAGPPGHFRHVSYTDVLHGRVPVKLFLGTLVLVGVTAASIGDRFATGGIDGTQLMSGVEFNANVIDALRRNLAITPLGVFATVTLTLVIVAVAGGLYAMSLPSWAVLVVGALGAVATSAGVLVFLQTWFAPAGVLVGVGASYAGIVWLDVRRKERRLEARDQEAKAALHSISDGVIIVGADTRVEHLNSVALRLSGLTPATAVGHPADAVFELREPGSRARISVSALMAAAAKAGERILTQTILRPASGAERSLQLSVAVMRDQRQAVRGAVLAFRDMTELQRVMRKMSDQGKRDPVTELPNRIGFLATLAWSLEQARKAGMSLPVMILDVDGFRRFNDTFGYEAGDALLAAIAQRLLTIRQGVDSVARLGNDEFGLLLARGTSESAVTFIARRTKRILEKPFLIHGFKMPVTVSIGVGGFPRDGDDIETVVNSARHAARIACKQGGNAIEYHENASGVLDLSRERCAVQLKNALQQDQFDLHYQPQIELNSEKFIGVEALLRWRSPKRGLLLPSEFLPGLEANGLIITIGEWVFRTACRQMQEWSRLGWTGFRMSVNVSPQQLLDANFTNMITSALEEFKVDGHRIILEITENTMIQDFEKVTKIVKYLALKGVSFCIDDFGVGYASILHVRSILVSSLKVDKSIIHNSLVDAREAAILSGIVVMAHSMGLTVVAEGVETDRHAEFARANGCDEAQGFLYGEAVAPAQVSAQWRARLRSV